MRPAGVRPTSTGPPRKSSPARAAGHGGGVGKVTQVDGLAGHLRPFLGRGLGQAGQSAGERIGQDRVAVPQPKAPSRRETVAKSAPPAPRPDAGPGRHFSGGGRHFPGTGHRSPGGAAMTSPEIFSGKSISFASAVHILRTLRPRPWIMRQSSAANGEPSSVTQNSPSSAKLQRPPLNRHQEALERRCFDRWQGGQVEE